jgi:glycosyltransferase involved in cell wall biosynthesis
MALSVIVPVFNEAESLPLLDAELRAALDPGGAWEVVYVNDGSTDGSAAALDALAARHANVVVVHFRRNLGQTAAMMAGFDHAAGDVLAPLDADLQNDPADIRRLAERLNDGFDVVSGWRRHRQDAALTRTLPSRLANRLISAFTGVRLHDYGCSLKAYRRDALEGVRLYGEMHRFIPVYAAMRGARVGEVEVNHRARRFGRSKYGLGRVGKVLLDLLLVKFLAAYSQRPMYVFGGFGLGCWLASLPISLAVFFKLMPFDPAHPKGGWHKDFVETPLPVIAAALVLAGFLGILLGLQAEMLMRTYFEAQGKRTYVVDRVVRHAAAGAG